MVRSGSPLKPALNLQTHPTELGQERVTLREGKPVVNVLGRREGDTVTTLHFLHVRNVFGLEGQPPRRRFLCRRERPVEARLTGILGPGRFRDHGIDQEEVRLARREDPATVGRDVDADDGVPERGQGRLGVLSEFVKQAQVALGAADDELATFGRRGGGKVGLGRVLLELGIDELGPCQSRIDPEQTVVRVTDERLLLRRLRKLGIRQEVLHRKVFGNLVLVDDFARLEVEAVQRPGRERVLKDHRGVCGRVRLACQ